MIFRTTAAASILVSLTVIGQAGATCMTLDRERTPGDFETIYVCRNTLPKPTYTIVRHFISENTFGVFNFEPMGANMVCTDYEFAERKEAECRKAGIRPIASKYELKNANIRTRGLSELTRAQRESLYKRETLFAFPKTVAEIDDEQCFVHITKDRSIDLGYDERNFMEFSSCLIRFEEYLKRNKKFLLSLF